ncbi:EF-hand calcium binding domain 3, partial [Chelydra serpentina]
NIKMRGLKLILHNVGINVTHQEIHEALNRADIDGDGQVNFTDFVTVLTDDQRFAQSMVRPKESIIHDPYSVETLFFEVLTKLVEMSALPMKSEREVVRSLIKILSSIGPLTGCCGTQFSRVTFKYHNHVNVLSLPAILCPILCTPSNF